MMEIILLAGLGFLSGMASALFGIGGGTIIVPSLMLIGFELPFAIGISALQMIFASFFGSYLNYKKGLIPLKEGLTLGLGGLLGSSLSGLVLSTISSRVLLVIFLCFTLTSFAKFFFQSPPTNYKSKTLNPYRKTSLLLVFGIFVGLFSSSLGVGGGLLLAPLLGIFLGLNSKEVIPLALFFICFSSLSGTLSLYLAGFIHLKLGLLVGIFALVGVYLGIALLTKLSNQAHRISLFCVYLFSITITVIKIFAPNA